MSRAPPTSRDTSHLPMFSSEDLPVCVWQALLLLVYYHNWFAKEEDSRADACLHPLHLAISVHEEDDEVVAVAVGSSSSSSSSSRSIVNNCDSSA